MNKKRLGVELMENDFFQENFKTKISLAGTTTLITSNRMEIIDLLEKDYSEFISNKKEEFTINFLVKSNKKKITLNKKNVAPLTLPVSMKNSKEKGVFIFNKKGFSKIWKCKINLRRSYATIEVNLPNYKSKFINAFKISLMICYSLFFLKKKALMLHSSAVNKNNKALVFLGPSGEGKTTIMKLLSEDRTFSDDMNVLKVAGRKIFVFSFPFFGEFKGSKKGLPLKALFFIKKARKNFLYKLNPINSIFKLINSNFALNFLYMKKDPSFFQAFDFAMGVVKRSKCFNLEFLPEKKVWVKIRKVL
ncbi:MAG: hypothetical protein AB1467_01855 [Candidatus Diapherotrites archaeon]